MPGLSAASLQSLCKIKRLLKLEWGWRYVRSNTKIAKSLILSLYKHILLSTIASPTCQQRQGERTFPILPLLSLFLAHFSRFFSTFSRFFALFFCRGKDLPPCPQAGYATGIASKLYCKSQTFCTKGPFTNTCWGGLMQKRGPIKF